MREANGWDPVGVAIQEWQWLGEAAEGEEQFTHAFVREGLSACGLKGRLFLSRSKGRGRPRKAIMPVLLFGYGSRWYLIKEGGDGAGERIPWDEIVQECGCGVNGWVYNGSWSGDELRSAVIRYLWRLRRF